MLYDRPYMQEPSFRNEVQALKWIIIANVAVFFLAQILVEWFRSPFLYEIFSLSWGQIRSGFIWTIATYSLIHQGFAHILINMIVVFLFGRTLQSQIGGQKLLELYVISVLFGALLWLPVNLSLNTIVMGASAGAAGLITAFCLRHLNQRITILLFFILPLSLTGKQMMAFFLGWELIGFLFYEMGPMVSFWPFFFNGVAYSAHLGGMLGGFLFYRYLLDRESIFRRRGPLIEVPQWVRKRAKGASSKPSFKINISNRNQLKTEVDRILDKINSEGFGSLSEEEKRTLDRAKDILSH